MKATRRSEPKTHAVIEKPPLAMVAKADRSTVRQTDRQPDGHAAASASQGDASREARVRDAAYARYESRGRVDGHDLVDWLAAEAEVPD